MRFTSATAAFAATNPPPPKEGFGILIRVNHLLFHGAVVERHIAIRQRNHIHIRSAVQNLHNLRSAQSSLRIFTLHQCHHPRYRRRSKRCAIRPEIGIEDAAFAAEQCGEGKLGGLGD